MGTRGGTERTPPPPPRRDASSTILDITVPIERNCCDRSVPEFHKRPCLHRTLDIRNISQTKINQFLILLLPQPANEAIARQRLPQSYSRQAIFREAEIEKPRDGD